jgi:hypothetical protein
MPGTHAQNVRCTLLEEQLAPASTLAEALALGLELALALLDAAAPVDEPLLLEQAAASSETAATPVSAAVMLARGRRDLDNIWINSYVRCCRFVCGRRCPRSCGVF